jgi:RNA polymerase sigma-70 factor (ECF subfamily)
MLRITPLNGGSGVTLRLEGKLRTPWDQELERAFSQAATRAQRVTLDLQGVSYADEAGTRLLRRLLAGGAAIDGCSSFLQELLGHAERPPLDAAGETDLIARIRDGDDRACEQLVRAHYDRMLKTASRLLRDPNDQADAVQDALISAFRAIGQFDGSARVATWLHRITVNACLMRIRSEKRRPALSIEELIPKFDGTGHHVEPVRRWRDEQPDELVTAETRRQVRDCIDQLPEPYRTVVLLRDIEGLSTEETAELTHCSVANVKTRLHRARMALRKLLEPVFQTV